MKKDKKEQIPAEKQEEQSSALPIGMCLGLAVGAAIGTATGNLAMWMGVGIALGVAVGASMDAAKKKTPPKGETAEDKDQEETPN